MFKKVFIKKQINETSFLCSGGGTELTAISQPCACVQQASDGLKLNEKKYIYLS